MIRNRREDYIDDEEIEFHKIDENKPYPYFLIIRSLFYAFIISMFVCKLFLFVYFNFISLFLLNFNFIYLFTCV